MSTDSVTFRIDGEVEVAKLADALIKFTHALDVLCSDADADVKWIVAGLEFGSASATARAVPRDPRSGGRVDGMCRRYLDVARHVADGRSSGNLGLDDAFLALAGIASSKNPIIFETSEDDVLIKAPLPARPSMQPDRQTTKSLGTVRGRVETLSHRKVLRFSLYELAHDRPVSCYLEPDHETLMRDAWGRIADVTGRVSRDALTGRPISIRGVTNVDVVADEGDPAGFLRARGALRSTEQSEVVIRRLRDAS
jgi:hypothetical protein